MSKKRRSQLRARTHAQTSCLQPDISPQLQATLIEIVDNQLRGGSPPETRQTLDRLIQLGYTPESARELISYVVLAEIYGVLKSQQPFREECFVAALHRLPTLPEE